MQDSLPHEEASHSRWDLTSLSGGITFFHQLYVAFLRRNTSPASGKHQPVFRLLPIKQARGFPTWSIRNQSDRLCIGIDGVQRSSAMRILKLGHQTTCAFLLRSRQSLVVIWSIAARHRSLLIHACLQFRSARRLSTSQRLIGVAHTDESHQTRFSYLRLMDSRHAYTVVHVSAC